MKAYIAVLALLACSVSALEFDRPCRDDVQAKERFSPAFFTGTWFELHNSLDQGGECIEHHYTRRGIQQVFDVERIGVAPVIGLVRETGIVSVAFPEETELRAIFNATLNRITGGVINYSYRIVATDYTNYAVFWSCTELPNGRSSEEGTVVSRSTSLSEASMVKIRALLDSVELNLDDFRNIEHTPEACQLV